MEVHRAERTIIETITSLTLLTPDHSTVIGANRPLETNLPKGAENGAHVDIAVVGRMRGLLKRVPARSPDVAAMREMNSSPHALDDLHEVVVGIRSQRSSAKCDAVRRVIDDGQHAFQ